VAERKQAVKNRSLCECCLTDCENEETGMRCYLQRRPGQHGLLGLAVEEEVALTDRTERKGGPSLSRAGRDRQLKDTHPEKFKRLSRVE
jgi:hypothetical protein